MKEIGHPQPFIHDAHAAESHALFFQNDLEWWRVQRREEFDEQNWAISLVPMTKNGERHDVVWLERVGIDQKTGDKTIAHHAACKCIASPECRKDPELAPMLECNAWKEGVIKRAINIRAESSTAFGEMLNLWVEIDDVDYSGVMPSGLGLDPVDEAILLNLREVKVRPAYWAGNIVGGVHELPLLSIITGHELPELTNHAHRLKEMGWVDFDGRQTLSLAA